MRAPLVVVVALSLAGCEHGASPELGLDALLQVDGAQFRPGPFPSPAGGPAALSLQTRRAELRVGEYDGQLRGVLEAPARGAVIGVDGVEGAWLLPASVPDLDTPGLATVSATFGLAADFPVGPFTLLVAASDADGRFGEPASTMVLANEVPVPEGELVIGLRWPGRADLDLHVIDPLGGEAYSDDPNTWDPPPPGTPVDPSEYLTGGILDHDGNKDCRRDGSPNEHVIWQQPPPDGEYIVRVDARSLCGAASADWHVIAYRSGALIGAARGVATPEDVQQPHGAGAGVTALRFTCGAEGCALP